MLILSLHIQGELYDSNHLTSLGDLTFSLAFTLAFADQDENGNTHEEKPPFEDFDESPREIPQGLG